MNIKTKFILTMNLITAAALLILYLIPIFR